MRKLGVLCRLLPAVLFLAACGHDIHTPVDPENLKDLFASGPAAALKDAPDDCVANAQGAYVESAVQIDGQGKFQDHDFAQGGACVNRPIAQVWAASRAHEAFHWDRSDLDSVKEAPEKTGAYRFLSDQSAGGFGISVSWTIQWDHDVVVGSKDAPTRVLIRFQKVDGTSHIAFWQGALTLKALTANTTAVLMRDVISADGTDDKDTAQAVRDYIGKLRTL